MSVQGQALCKVLVMLSDSRPFVPNWLYVACSRVKDLKHLTFSRPVKDSDVWSTLKGAQKPHDQKELNL